MSKLLKHGPCPECGSTDNLAIYDDHEHCFSEGCGYDLQYNNNKERTIEQDTTSKVDRRLTPLPSRKMPALRERGLDATTINKYLVTVNTNPDDDTEAVFPRFNQAGDHIANQVRRENKQFRCEGDLKGARLFGQDFFPEGGRSITVTEGYYDTLAAFQLTGSRYPNVGVRSASLVQPTCK